MKKTFLAILIAGGSMAAIAQTAPTTPTPTTTPTTSPTNDPTTTTNSTSDPMKTTTNAPMNNTNATTNTSASWNSVTAPSWGWNSYGIWDNSAHMNNNVNGTASMDGTTSSNVDGNVTNANLNSTGSYNAYGTTVAALPPNVQMRFDKEFPNTTGTAYTWKQYGDWFHSHYMSNGRLIQYYYDMRGNGYSLALPVIQTYVPEEVIDRALQKYGSNLYSVSMVKTAEGKDAYQIGLLERGQMRMEYLNEDGSSVANVWRTEDLNANGAMITTDANAAMDTQNRDTSTADEKETKTKWKENGMKTKIKSGDGKVKVKQKKVDD